MSSRPALSSARPQYGRAQSLSVLLEYWANQLGDSPAVTFLDYSADPDGVASTLTWRGLDALATDVAGWVSLRTAPGDRVAILVEQSQYYAAAFLGVLRAQRIAVPLFPPGVPRHDERLAAVLADCAPGMLLCTRGRIRAIEKFLDAGNLFRPQVVAVDALPPGDTSFPAEPLARADDIAYLQYTSGSTRTPTGVMLTHANVLANCGQAAECFGVEHGRTVDVSWLPLFHDMGLVLGLAVPVLTGTRSVLLDPGAFLERPARWLRALSANPAAITAAPSFAYSYAAARTSPQERALLRLDDVVTLVDGSEPVQAANIARFHDTFAECGLRRGAHRPSYGLAEATVLVASGSPAAEPTVRTFDSTALTEGVAADARQGAASTTLVGSGRAVDQQVRIVDPLSATPVEDGTVGEIWVSGPNVGLGYWGRAAETGAAFGAGLRPDTDPLPRGVDGRGWLRTGDLGVLVEGELFITGRIKDLIIVDGRNHYPQDVELTVEQAHPAVRRHSVAAFSFAGTDTELLVVFAERAKTVAGKDDEPSAAEVRAAARAAIALQHGLALHELWLLGPGEVPRTSSGKISRSACRTRYLTARERQDVSA
ncbi:Acyl-CoA synthetase (AMP-forming)/AMP-acid ligase II [Amycolatopsis marina]|uniref:Acyl-CoA synthetase (AMP-forming)/AMP-acid ligase II n=1 Tax=Amycolatopsis marina TaxID=490629 RepID=A0A1I1B1I8_9PSEU|nr:fatty acyl-AMP ligase [Amycolatopsis marina]SFB44214.1 Acyl-CoA synthetase (AMP-forming)/AMP-acid ligase II [Amycolatopsis marina]